MESSLPPNRRAEGLPGGAWILDAEERRFVQHLTRSLEPQSHDAEELEQELWLAIHGSGPGSERARRSWLRIVARRIMARRMLRRRREVDREQLYASDRALHKASLASEASAGGRPPGLEKALSALSPVRRRVLSLRYEMGCSFSEIATQLDIAEATARSHHHRAIESLREDLHDSQGGSGSAWGVSLFFGWWNRARRQMAAVRAALAIMGTAAGILLLKIVSGAPDAGATPSVPSPDLRALPQRVAVKSAPRREVPARSFSRPRVSRERPTQTRLDAATVPSKLRILNADGDPQSGVQLFGLHSEIGAIELSETSLGLLSDAAGLLTLPSLPPGTWVVAEDPRGRRSRAILADHLRYAPEVIDLRLRRRSRTWALEVRGVGGEPLQGALIRAGRRTLSRLERASTLFPTARCPRRSALTEEGGRAPVPVVSLAKVDTVHWVVANGYATQAFRGEPGHLELTPSRSLHGRVLSENGEPLAGAELTLILEGTSATWQARSRRDGSFVLHDAPLGTVRLEAVWATDGLAEARPRGAGAQLQMDLGVDLADAVEVRVTADAVVEGRVLDATGSPLTGARVELVPSWHDQVSLLAQPRQQHPWSSVAETARDGSFTVLRREAKCDLLRVLHRDTGEVVAISHLDQATNQPIDLTVRARPAMVHTGVLGSPESHIRRPDWVIVADAWSQAPRVVEVDAASGRFRFKSRSDRNVLLQPAAAATADALVKSSRGEDSGLLIHSVDLDSLDPPVVIALAPRAITITAHTAEGLAVRALRIVAVEGHVIHRGKTGAIRHGSLSVSADGVATLLPSSDRPLMIEVTADQESLFGRVWIEDPARTTAEVLLSPVPAQEVWFTLPENAQGRPLRRIFEIRDSADNVLVQRPIGRLRAGNRRSLSTRLAPGTYRMTVATDDRVDATFTF
ncbi:MAG: sigma-70 family RNA polymerase sigma factor, partial [Planctomycetota bacterium]